MPRRKIQFINGEFYHIIKRGIEDRKIFLDKEDRFRLINSLLVFNDRMSTPWKSRAFWHQRAPDSLPRGNYRPKTPLVEIHAFVLMPNHFHLLLCQLIENGIPLLMQKLGGYSYYFNKKYRRVGTLFQDRYKVVHVKAEEQLKNNFVYVHTNPIALIERGWKEWKINNPQKAVKFLEKDYRWSSYWDYLGKENFPSVTNREFFLRLFRGREEVKKEVNSWIRFKTTSPGLVEEWE